MRITIAGCGIVAILAIAVGWSQNPGHITASEAVSAARAAFAASGIDDAEVDPTAEAGGYKSKSNGTVRVWKTSAEIDGGTIQLWLARSDGKSMFLDDRSADGSTHLLTETQFRRLADHYENPAVSRQIRRNIALTLAALLVAGFAVVHLRRPEILQSAQPPDEPPLPPPPAARPRRTRPRRTRPLRAMEA